MEVIKPGISYKLKNFNDAGIQTISFVEKVNDEFKSGTTNEEIINMLIDRFYTLNGLRHSPNNKVCIKHLKAIKTQLEDRIIKKKKYVENKIL